MDKKAASSSGDDPCQPLIPGLPDDLALRCLARLSHGYHGLLELVCKRWRDTIRSLGYARVKSQEGWTGNWLFVFTEEQIKINGQWIAYDPEADRWHPLPPIPFANTSKRHWGFSCVCVAKTFLLIGGFNDFCKPRGGFIATKDVIKFDPFSNQWSRVSSMRVARANFACAVVHDKVYVAGGCNLSDSLPDVEVYDPTEDSWQDIPPLLSVCKNPVGFSYGGLFYVADGMDAQIFDPIKGSWYSQQKIWPFFRLLPCPVATVKECIYTIDDWDGNHVKYWDPMSSCWINIGSVPSVQFSGHSHGEDAISFGVIGFQNEMYVIGGKFYKRKGRKREGVKLNLVRVCKISGEQLEWREVRPIRGFQGRVVGCAVLEE